MELRCAWVTKDPEYIEYHDKQWGRPVYDPRELFAKLYTRLVECVHFVQLAAVRGGKLEQIE